MLLCAPPTPRCSAQEIRSAANQKTIQIHAMFLLLKKIHNIDRTYTFNAEALELFDQYFNKFSNAIDRIISKDSYLA
jgi:hypothetical protein